MPRRVEIPEEVQEALARLGRNIRTARLRRRWRLVDLAERVGVSRYVMSDVERGKPTVSIGTYLGALWAFDLLDPVRELADPERDEEGKALERARGPRKARRPERMDDDF